MLVIKSSSLQAIPVEDKSEKSILEDILNENGMGLWSASSTAALTDKEYTEYVKSRKEHSSVRVFSKYLGGGYMILILDDNLVEVCKHLYYSWVVTQFSGERKRKY